MLAGHRLAACLARRISASRSPSETSPKAASMSSSSGSGPAGEAKAALVFLHGLGDQGSSWQAELSHIVPSHVKCHCPTAPSQPVTLNLGMRMNSWFDLRSLDPDEAEDELGIRSACKQIHELLDELGAKQGVASHRIVLGGFSQGGALALYSALTYPKKLAAVVALSCWLPLHKSFPEQATQIAKSSLPIMQCHGDQDFVVPFEWGKRTERILDSFVNKPNYTFKEYHALGHSSSPKELRDVAQFVAEHLPR